MSELDLIRKAQKGSRKSQNHLYKLYYSYVMSIALRFSSNREEAQEIVHDAFMKMFANLGKFDRNLNFKAWLRKIVVNTSIDHYRKYQTIPNHLEVLENDIQVDNTGLSNLATEEIMGAIAMLSPSYRIVLTLYIVEGFTHQEIADRLDISIGTSKSNLAKARNRLKTILNEQLGIQQRKHGGL